MANDMPSNRRIIGCNGHLVNKNLGVIYYLFYPTHKISRHLVMLKLPLPMRCGFHQHPGLQRIIEKIVIRESSFRRFKMFILEQTG